MADTRSKPEPVDVEFVVYWEQAATDHDAITMTENLLDALGVEATSIAVYNIPSTPAWFVRVLAHEAEPGHGPPDTGPPPVAEQLPS
jgi:hypothetical protein